MYVFGMIVHCSRRLCLSHREAEIILKKDDSIAENAKKKNRHMFTFKWQSSLAAAVIMPVVCLEGSSAILDVSFPIGS